MEISEHAASVFERIRTAALSVGRDPQEIILVAASKMNDASRVREAFDAGVTVFGENRVQEMLEKNAQNAYAGAQLHFIGHLQRNKVRQVVGLASLIHSADSLDLIREIDRCAEKRGLCQELLLEINIGGEASKSGFSPDQLPAVLETAAGFSHVSVRGLMAIPPACENPSENIPFFEAMRQLFVDNRGKKYDNVSMDLLSMGMSGDFEAAIACGSNMVRIGSALFGPRNYNT
jgi:pyridoxal phosphate enzyme (YggS family)